MVHGIRRQIISTYVYVVLIAMAILGLFLIWFLHDQYLAEMHLKMVNEARLISGFISEEMVAEQYVKADQQAKLFGRELGSRITVVLTDGRVVADTDFNPAELDNHKTRPEIKTALRGDVGEGVRYSTSSIIENLYVAVPIKSADQIIGAVRIAMPLSNIKQTLFQLLGLLLVGMLLAILVGMAFFLKMAKGLTGPLENISAGAKKVAAGDWTTKVYSVPGNELGELGQSLNTMTQKLKEQIDEVSQGKSRLENIVNTMGSGVIVLDKAGKVQKVNRAAEKMFGISFVTAEGKHNLEVIRHFGLNDQIEKCLHQAQVIEYEFIIFHPAETDIQCYIAPVFRDKDLAGVTVVFHDITELRKVEKMRSDFVANASHELRTPLTVIKGYAETLLGGALSDPEAREKFVAVIDQEADRMRRLVDELLILSRLESQDAQRENGHRDAAVDVSTIIRAVTDEMMPRFMARKIALQIELPGELPAVSADGDQLKQVMSNLLDNALKYTAEGGQIWVDGEDQGGMVAITVRDNGIGIPAADLPRIFERFYRVDKARQRQLGGFGLGLAIVKHIVENFGGRISVESKPYEGSTFRFTVPKAK